ncbi:spore coat protein [Bacillus sp. HMF5848]|uniref:spore coat protein n=1 Tax=Bacillus sp. HMF5848 TaxID=2495421 RepID=UPI000F77EEFF|nr:spore coat protein [Bacillus sp. HMF5848]
MLNEKDMVADYLSQLNASLGSYAQVIAQSDNKQLRDTFVQIRNQDEQKQWEVYQAALQRNYYTPASKASHQDVQQVKQQFMQGNQQSQMNQQMMNQQMNQNMMYTYNQNPYPQHNMTDQHRYQ